MPGQPGEEVEMVSQAVGQDTNIVSGITERFSWNIFRYVGDFIHLAGVAIMLLTMFKNKSVVGFSLRTALCYAVLFTCRYMDLFTHSQPFYLVFFKITYIITSFVALHCFHKWWTSFERQKDTVNIGLILIGCFVAALFTTDDPSWVQTLWVYSQYIEAFALVPQYVFCYRDPDNRDAGITLFVICIGLYRVMYACNWIYKKAMMSHYSDIHSWIGGIVEILFFCDYMVHHFGGVSMLKTSVLGVDNTIRVVSDKIEFATLGTSSVIRDRQHEGLRQRLPTTDKEARDLEMDMEMGL